MAAIVHADVMGSTALVQLDQALAHERINNAFQRLAQSIERYGGTVHEVRGDAMVAEFSRASDAVSAALDFQAANNQTISELEDEIRPAVRIGVSLGEVIVAEGHVTGAGVVLAQRIEQLADPGGVCITAAIHEALPRQMPFQQLDLGEQVVKGFDEPVRVYRVSLASGKTVPPPEDAVHKKSGISLRKPVVLIGGLVIVVLVGLLWFKPWTPVQETASEDRMAFPLPDKPSIAVLPFANLSDDPEQEYFVDGIAEDLITDLSRVAGLFVIARNSTFVYKDQHVDIRRVAEDLGVRYVLEGSVRRSGETVRINAQLIDATSGGHVWADRYDGEMDNVFDLQDKVTGSIVTVLTVQLTNADRDRVAHSETSEVQAYDAYLQGWQHYLRQTPEDFRSAIVNFERAIELDPEYGRAYAALAATYWETWKRVWHQHVGITEGSHEPRFRAESYLVKAMQNPTPLAHQVASAMLLHQQQYDEGIAEAQNAIQLDPNDADSYIALANALTLSGEAREAVEWIDRALRLNPHYPPFYLYQLGLTQFALNEIPKAAESLEKAIALNPDDRWAHRLLIASYGALDRVEDANAVIEAMESRDDRGWLNTMDPLTISTSAFWLPFKQPADSERLSKGLRNAGIPD